MSRIFCIYLYNYIFCTLYFFSCGFVTFWSNFFSAWRSSFSISPKACWTATDSLKTLSWFHWFQCRFWRMVLLNTEFLVESFFVSLNSMVSFPGLIISDGMPAVNHTIVPLYMMSHFSLAPFRVFFFFFFFLCSVSILTVVCLGADLFVLVLG